MFVLQTEAEYDAGEDENEQNDEDGDEEKEEKEEEEEEEEKEEEEGDGPKLHVKRDLWEAFDMDATNLQELYPDLTQDNCICDVV